MEHGGSDEELAMRLQAQFLSEELGIDPGLGGVSEQDLLREWTERLQRQQEDEALAKKLQEELNLEAHHSYSPSFSTYSPPAPAPAPAVGHPPVASSLAAVATTTTVTPTATASLPESSDPLASPTLLEAAAAAEDEDFQCLICYETPEEYVVLSGCQTPHIYCWECAGRLQKQSATHIQCPFCSVVTPLNSNLGLRALRRRRRKEAVNLESGLCSKHGKMLLYFCFDCLELACTVCENSGIHHEHQRASLEVALQTCKRQMATQILELGNKQHGLESYEKGVERQLEETRVNSEERLKELREQMAAIRRELDQKEEQFARALEQMRDRKLANLRSERKWANEKLQQVTKGVELAGRVLFNDSKPLWFFQELMQHEEEFMALVNLPSKELQPNASRFPILPTAVLPDLLSRMRYVENRSSVYDSTNANVEDGWDFWGSDDDDSGLF